MLIGLMGSHTATAGKMKAGQRKREQRGTGTHCLYCLLTRIESLWDETTRNTDSGRANDLNYGADSYS